MAPVQPMDISQSLPCRPFLKWPGGKMRLIRQIIASLPEKTILAEPFVGAGSLFVNTQHEKIYINDINADLINIYRQLKKRKQGFIKAAAQYFDPQYHCPIAYYEIRDQFNRSTDPFLRACLFLYLNRHGYNGLCRYNASGAYNVPFGDYKSPYFPHQELTFFIDRLQHAQISCLSYAAFFAQLEKKTRVRDVVFYCDPPYAPLSKTANFTSYTPTKFTQDDQVRLAELCLKSWEQSAGVVISNHDIPLTRDLYQKAAFKSFSLKRLINCKTECRQTEVKELLAIYDPCKLVIA